MVLVRGKDGVAEICDNCEKVRPNPPTPNWATVEVQVGKNPLIVREFHLCPKCWREIAAKLPPERFYWGSEELEILRMIDKTGV